MIETWLPVKGYEALYEVSSLGRIKSLSRVTPHGQSKLERVLRPYAKPGRAGNYLLVKLSKCGSSKAYLVHRLVALAFIQTSDAQLEVNHIDMCRQNNSVGNLEWVTAKRNFAHSLENGRRHPRSRKVLITDGAETYVFDQCRLADDFLWVSSGSVSNAISRGQRVRGWEVGFI